MKIILSCSNNHFHLKKLFGDAGYRSRYLPHAKRALYHLSYTPVNNSIFQYVLEKHILLIHMNRLGFVKLVFGIAGNFR